VGSLWCDLCGCKQLGVQVENVDGDLEGLNAVIDKDFTAALVAQELNAGLLVLLTNAPKVCTDFGLSSEAPIDRLTLQSALPGRSRC